MEAKHQIELLKALANDIEKSANDLKATNTRYRQLIIKILPIILKEDFDIPSNCIPSNLYLEELCTRAEDESKFLDLQRLCLRPK